MSAMTRPFDRPVLYAPPLILRRPEPRDSDAIVRICGDAEIARRLARVPHPYGATDAAFFLDHVVPHEWVWAITLDGDDTLIGVVGLTPGDDPASAAPAVPTEASHGSGTRSPRRRDRRDVKWSGREDSNLRPLPPEGSALPG